MEFKDLQSIWDTQNDKPVFAMQDPRLLVALYQQRERSRRRILHWSFAPLYVTALIMVGVIGSLVAAFRNIAGVMRRYPRFTHHGFGISAWDYAGLAVAAAALLVLVVSLYLERKKHERTQEIFAPSLREELDRGIAQLDFWMGLDRPARILRILTLLAIALVLTEWESGRAAGNPRPWWTLLWALAVFLPGFVGFALKKKPLRREHRRALVAMRTALDEEIREDT